MSPPDPVLSDSPTILAVGLLTSEVKTNTFAMIELSKRIEKLETLLGGEAAEFGMKTNFALLQQKVESIEAKEAQMDQWKRSFKTNLYIAILAWLLSVIYNLLPILHPPNRIP